jgi:hypothetical protein
MRDELTQEQAMRAAKYATTKQEAMTMLNRVIGLWCIAKAEERRAKSELDWIRKDYERAGLSELRSQIDFATGALMDTLPPLPKKHRQLVASKVNAVVRAAMGYGVERQKAGFTYEPEGTDASF